MDVEYHIRLREVLAGITEEEYFPALSAEAERNKIVERLAGRYFILSLASNCQSSAMWAHYAANHTGICVGFNMDHPFFKGRPQLISPLKPVMYRTAPPVYSEFERDAVLFTKAVEWAYEQESRMVYDFDAPLRIKSKSPCVTREIQAIDGSKSGLLVRLPHRALREIIVGYRAQPEFRQYASERAHKLKVKLFDAAPSNASYLIEKRARV